MFVHCNGSNNKTIRFNIVSTVFWNVLVHNTLIFFYVEKHFTTLDEFLRGLFGTRQHPRLDFQSKIPYDGSRTTNTKQYVSQYQLISSKLMALRSLCNSHNMHEIDISVQFLPVGYGIYQYQFKDVYWNQFEVWY